MRNSRRHERPDWAAVLTLVCCLSCSSGESGGNDATNAFMAFTHRGSEPSGTLLIMIEMKSYRFVSTASPASGEVRPLPQGVFERVASVMSGELVRHYRDLGTNDENCSANGYSFDGQALDSQAAGGACFIPDAVTDPAVKTMLETMIPIYEQLATAQ